MRESKAMEISALFLASLLSLFLFSQASAKDVANNPADQLVAALNSNRTAHKSTSLYANPGLGCLALEYIKAYSGQCDKVGDNMKPPDSDFADTFAPNCGVDAKSLSPITGRLLVCQSKYVQPNEAFDLLIRNDRSLQILYDKNHTEVGAAARGTDGGAPYFWSVLFSGGKNNASFVFADGTPKVNRPGCYSGANDECSGASGGRMHGGVWVSVVVGVLSVVVCVVFGL